MDVLIGIGVGVVLAAVLAGGAWLIARRRRRRRPEVHVHTSIEELRSVGELSVFKVITKEIVTARDHWAGDFGKRYLEWLSSSRKMAMIFEFDIDFRFDLLDSRFEIEPEGEGAYRLRLPPCKYDIHIRDIRFYDEQNSRLLPWLLPDVINNVFAAGFNEEQRNQLTEEAKAQAQSLATGLVDRLRSEVQSSARETLEALAKGFSAEHVAVEFSESEPKAKSVQYQAALPE
jgi:hypothetical protein